MFRNTIHHQNSRHDVIFQVHCKKKLFFCQINLNNLNITSYFEFLVIKSITFIVLAIFFSFQ